MGSTTDFVHLYTVAGMLQANLVKSLLEAAEIPALVYGESAATAYGFTVGEMAEVELWVPADRLDEAREMIEKFESPAPEDDEADTDEQCLTGNSSPTTPADPPAPRRPRLPSAGAGR